MYLLSLLKETKVIYIKKKKKNTLLTQHKNMHILPLSQS